MDQLITEFKLRTITKNNKTYINLNDVKSRLYIPDILKLIDDEHIEYRRIDNNDDDDKINFDAYASFSDIKRILTTHKSHPEHYNAHKILGIKNTYRKKDEIRILAEVYEHFRADYNIIYQYSFLEFKIDAHIVIEITQQGGIVIEIDEGGHKTYNKKDNEERQKIIESCGFCFIRINPNKYDKDEIIEQIKEIINEYEMMYTIDVSPDTMWKQMQDKTIDRDFYNFMGKSVVSNKRYSVEFDDVVKYLSYSSRGSATKLLRRKFKPNIEYIELTKDELTNRDDIFMFNCLSMKKSNRETKNNRGGHNKKYIFMCKQKETKDKRGGHKILGIQVTYRKKDEFKILVDIYGHFQRDYNIMYQYPF